MIISPAPDLPLYRVDAVLTNHEELLVTVLYENCYSPRGGKPTTYQVVCEQFVGNLEDFPCHEGNLQTGLNKQKFSV